MKRNYERASLLGCSVLCVVIPVNAGCSGLHGAAGYIPVTQEDLQAGPCKTAGGRQLAPPTVGAVCSMEGNKNS